MWTIIFATTSRTAVELIPASYLRSTKGSFLEKGSNEAAEVYS
jgi:hypothetical protein